VTKLVVVLRGPADVLVELGAPRNSAASRYEVDVAQSYPESIRYPSRAGITGVVLVTAGSSDAELLAITTAACGGKDAVAAAYSVEERLHWDYERTWNGPQTPGLKQVSFLSRADGLTRARFAEHWRTVHAPLASKHHPTIWRYVQNVVIEPLTEGAPKLDGVAELSYRSYEDWRDRKYDSPEGQAIITADLPRFINAASAWHVLAHEYVLADV
jgi:uncharacterized protein (TIGR02118 family)